MAYQEVSLNSAGSAQEKFTIYQESATAASERLQTEFEKLFMTMDSKGIKGFINLGTGILKTINAMGGLNTILLLTISILMLWKGEAVISFFAGLPRLIMSAVTAMRTFGTTAATLQSTLGAIGLVLVAISIAYGLVSSANEKANQIAQEGLETYQSQIQALTDLKTKLNETISGTGTESEKRATLIEMIKGMNTEYEKEAENLTAVNDLRDLAIQKIEEEGKAAADAFMAKSGEKYLKAKQFMEEDISTTGSYAYWANIGITTGSSKEVIKELEEGLLSLQEKQVKGIKLTRQEEVNLEAYRREYTRLSEKYAELLPYYEQGNAALAIQNGLMIDGAEAISDSTSEMDNFQNSIKGVTGKFSDLLDAIDPLDSALTKLAGAQALSSKEIFSLIDKYPELIDYLKTGTNGYYLQADAIELVRKGLIQKSEVELKTAMDGATAILKSSGIIIDVYAEELSAIKERIEAEKALYQARMIGLQNISYAAQMEALNEYKKLQSLLDSIGDLKAQKIRLDIIASTQDVKAVKTKTAEDAAQKAKDAKEKAQKEADDKAKDAADKKKDAEDAAQKKLEEYWKARIEVNMNRIEAERKATEDSFNQQIEALDKINDARQDEIDLIKAKEALLHAQTQKRMVYREGMGFVAETDKGAIAEAEQALAGIGLENKKKALEAQKDKSLGTEDLKKSEYQNKLLKEMQATTNVGLRSIYGSALGLTEFDGHWYDSNGKKAFKNGGIADYTGLAMMHGKPNAQEVIFNSSQASALFNWVQGLANPSVTRTPSIAGASTHTVNISTVNLPSVKNATDFITELQLISKNR